MKFEGKSPHERLLFQRKPPAHSFVAVSCTSDDRAIGVGFGGRGATIRVGVNPAEEMLLVASRFAPWHVKLAHVADDQGRGCCVRNWDIERPHGRRRSSEFRGLCRHTVTGWG